MSCVFARVMKQLGIQHNVSSAYHPESQGALERYHQTLKSMLRAYCLETGRDWADAVPVVVCFNTLLTLLMTNSQMCDSSVSWSVFITSQRHF